MMVTVEDAIIARIEKKGKHFEILVDSELAYGFKEGKSVSVQKMLASNIVFTDARKAVKAPEPDILSCFGTHDPIEIAKMMIKDGEVQLTADFRRRKVEEKRKQIAEFISKNAINPQTKLPHPHERVLNAMDQARINIDPFKPVDMQVEDVIKAIRPIIPISVEEATIVIQIPPQFSSRSFGPLKAVGSVIEQSWLSDGSLFMKLKIPAGMKEDVFRKINAMTQGNAKVTESK